MTILPENISVFLNKFSVYKINFWHLECAGT